MSVVTGSFLFPISFLPRGVIVGAAVTPKTKTRESADTLSPGWRDGSRGPGSRYVLIGYRRLCRTVNVQTASVDRRLRTAQWVTPSASLPPRPAHVEVPGTDHQASKATLVTECPWGTLSLSGIRVVTVTSADGSDHASSIILAVLCRPTMSLA
jgi:hypothetical protein